MLTFQSAAKHAPSGQWIPDIYDVLDGKRIVGRIARTSFAPQDRPWFWSITERIRQQPEDRGYAATSDNAVVELRRRWELVKRAAPK
jgi:hypothetical protein